MSKLSVGSPYIDACISKTFAEGDIICSYAGKTRDSLILDGVHRHKKAVLDAMKEADTSSKYFVFIRILDGSYPDKITFDEFHPPTLIWCLTNQEGVYSD